MLRSNRQSVSRRARPSNRRRRRRTRVVVGSNGRGPGRRTRGRSRFGPSALMPQVGTRNQTDVVRRPPRGMGIISQSYSVPPRMSVIMTRHMVSRRFSQGLAEGQTVSGRVPVQFVRFISSQGTDNLGNINDSTSSILYKEAPLNPIVLFPNGSPERAFASIYEKFRFRSAKLVFTPQTSTSTAGAIWLSYFPDGAITTSDIDAAGGQPVFAAQACSLNTPIWLPAEVDVSASLPNLDDFWFCSPKPTASATDADLRQSMQGCIISMWDIVPTAGGYYGYIWLEYEMDFIGQGQSISIVQAAATDGIDAQSVPVPATDTFPIRELKSSSLIGLKPHARSASKRQSLDRTGPKLSNPELIAMGKVVPVAGVSPVKESKSLVDSSYDDDEKLEESLDPEGIPQVIPGCLIVPNSPDPPQPVVGRIKKRQVTIPKPRHAS